MRLTVEIRNHIVQLLTLELAGGMLVLYDGTPPAEASATPWQDPIVLVPLETPAFGPPHDGQALAPDPAPQRILRTADARWAQLVRADGSVVADVAVRALDDPNARPGDLLLDRTDCQRGGICQLTRLLLTVPMQSATDLP